MPTEGVWEVLLSGCGKSDTYMSMADNLKAIKCQQKEFEKFYFQAMVSQTPICPWPTTWRRSNANRRSLRSSAFRLWSVRHLYVHGGQPEGDQMSTEGVWEVLLPGYGKSDAYMSMADNLKAIKCQQKEFEKFYFQAMVSQTPICPWPTTWRRSNVSKRSLRSSTFRLW